MPLDPLPYREVKRRLQAASFIEHTQKGSHVKFALITSEETRTAIVPKHREIKAGTLRGILCQAGITEERWIELN